MQAIAYLILGFLISGFVFLIIDVLGTGQQHRAYLAELNRIKEDYDRCLEQGRKNDAEDLLMELLRTTPPSSRPLSR